MNTATVIENTERNPLLLWLLVSVAAHLLLLPVFIDKHQSTEQPLANPPLLLKLKKKIRKAAVVQPAPTVSEKKEVVKTDAVEPSKAQPQKIEQADAVTTKNTEVVANKRFVLDDQILKQAIAETTTSKGGVTDNGAVIMNGGLLEYMQGQERSRFFAVKRSLLDHNRVGGQFAQHIKVGDYCFNFIPKDLGNNLSKDQWFMASCE